MCDKQQPKLTISQQSLLSPLSTIPTAIELRSKLTRQFTTTGHLSKTLSPKKALKFIRTLFTLRQPYWIMSPVCAQCVEYQCQLPWNHESMSKLFNILLYVMLFDENSQPSQGAAGNSQGLSPSHVAVEGISRTTTRDSFQNPSTSRRGTVFSLTDPSLSSGQISTNRGQLGRQNSTDSGFWNMNPSKPVRNGVGGANTSSIRMNMLKTLDSTIGKVWNTFAHPFLKIHVPRSTNERRGSDSSVGSFFSNSRSQIIPCNPQLDHISSLDSLASCDCNYLECDDEQFLRMAYSASLTISLHELCLVLVRCWVTENNFIKKLLVRSVITTQRRTGIVGCYDSSHAVMTATERLAITRLLHFYRNDTSSSNNPALSTPKQQQSATGKISYPGLFQFRGVDWDEVDHQSLGGFFPFSIPATLLVKSRVEQDTLAQQVAEMLIDQQRKDIEDDLAWKERQLKEEEDDQLPDVIELIREDTPLDSEEENEEENHRFVEHLLHEVESGELAAMDEKGRIRKVKVTPPIERLPLMNEQVVTELSSHLPQHSGREQFNAERDQNKQTPGGLAKTVKTSERPLSGVQIITSRLSTGNQQNPTRPLSAFRTKDGHVSLVELVDTPSDILQKVNLVARPTSGLKQSDLLPTQKFSSFPSGFSRDPLEDQLNQFDEVNHVNKPNGNRIQHEVVIENGQHRKHSIASATGNKIYVDGDLFQAVPLALSAQTSLAMTPDELYQKSLNEYRLSKVTDIRARIMSRVSSQPDMFLEPSLLKDKPKTVAEHVGDETNDDEDDDVGSGDMSGDEDEDESGKPGRNTKHMNKSVKSNDHEFDSVDVLGSFGHVSTGGNGGSYQTRFRIAPYLNLSKHINNKGELLLDSVDKLMVESAVQFLSTRRANITLRTWQKIIKLFCRDWQLEYIKILDLSENSLLQLNGAKLLSTPLQKTCRLIHLGLKDMGIGDAGLKVLLKAMLKGGGSKHLLRIELQNNSLTFASDSISMLENFPNLR
jgi:hypothetical protein